MDSFALGSIVVSTKGHDKGNLYVVVGLNQKTVAVCDGKTKFLKKPKQKNISHLTQTNILDDEIATKLVKGLKINDQMIYHAIVKAKKIIKEELYG